jgi:hypothetical protein
MATFLDVIIAALQWRPEITLSVCASSYFAVRYGEPVLKQLMADRREKRVATASARLARETVEHTQRKVVAESPPRLRLLRIAFRDEIQNAMGTIGATITFDVNNDGHNSAHIVECNWRAFKTLRPYRLPADPDYATPDDGFLGGNDPRNGSTLGPSDSEPVWLHVSELSMAASIDRVVPGAYDLILLGYIRYEDDFKDSYVLGFCHAISPSADTVTEVGGTKYNYSRP